MSNCVTHTAKNTLCCVGDRLSNGIVVKRMHPTRRALNLEYHATNFKIAWPFITIALRRSKMYFLSSVQVTYGCKTKWFNSISKTVLPKMTHKTTHDTQVRVSVIIILCIERGGLALVWVFYVKANLWYKWLVNNEHIEKPVLETVLWWLSL